MAQINASPSSSFLESAFATTFFFPFFYDILIYNKSWKDHVRHVDKVLWSLQGAAKGGYYGIQIGSSWIIPSAPSFPCFMLYKWQAPNSNNIVETVRVDLVSPPSEIKTLFAFHYNHKTIVFLPNFDAQVEVVCLPFNWMSSTNFLGEIGGLWEFYPSALC